MSLSATALLLFALAGEKGAGARELGPGVEEVTACVERNAPKLSSRQEVMLVRKTHAGQSLDLRATLWWKRAKDGRSRLLARVDEPPDERGTAFLLIEREGRNDMFSYLPEYQKVRRITARSLTGSFLGSDFSYEDVAELQRLADHAKVERLADGAVEGRPTYVLAGYPAADSGSAYQKVVSQFDRETCVLSRVEFFGAGPEPVKEMRVPFADAAKHGDRWIPRKVTVVDREEESETTLTVLGIELDVDIPDKKFTETELNRTGH
jgi:hypothetical protein